MLRSWHNFPLFLLPGSRQCRTSHLCHSKLLTHVYHSHMDQTIRSSSAWKNLGNSPSPSGQRPSVSTWPPHSPYLENWSVLAQQPLTGHAGVAKCSVWTGDGRCHFPFAAQQGRDRENTCSSYSFRYPNKFLTLHIEGLHWCHFMVRHLHVWQWHYLSSSLSFLSHSPFKSVTSGLTQLPDATGFTWRAW